uniref:hypothetical protein n=1 Tax=Synechococcus sp. UW106 TaxID=368495 RepID=UPI000E0F0B41|nr:hypothetical protein [Synechococcus sp. UW106]
MKTFNNPNHPAIQELIRSHQEIGEPIIDTSDPWDEPFEQRIIREWEAEHGRLDVSANTYPALPQRPEAIDRSLKTQEEKDFWSTRTSEKSKQHQREVDSRRIEGITRNLIHQNRNEQGHFQIIDRKVNGLDGGQIDIKAELLEQRKRIDGFIAIYEMDREETDRWRADSMEVMLRLVDLLSERR